MPYKDKEKQKAYQRMFAKKKREEVIVALGGKCVKCATDSDLEIDHIDPDRKSISANIIVRMSADNPTRIIEIEKCQLLCHDHHLEKTALYRRSKMIHGTESMYNSGCRCDECRNGHRIYNRSRRVIRESLE